MEPFMKVLADGSFGCDLKKRSARGDFIASPPVTPAHGCQWPFSDAPRKHFWFPFVVVYYVDGPHRSKISAPAIEGRNLLLGV
jgi:hypothetical protein